MSVSVKFGSYDFSDQVEEWREITNLVVDSADVPERDGLYMRDGRIGPREFELRGSLDAASETALRTLRNSLRSGVLNKTANLYLFSDRYVRARATAYADDYVPGSGLTVMHFTIVFTSDLPYEQSDTLQSSGTVTTTTSGNTDFSVTNSGDKAAWAKVTVTAPTSTSTAISNNLTFYNLTRNEEFSYLGDIESGDALVVDATVTPPIVENDGVDDVANFDGDFIRLDPGSNSMRVVTDVDAEVLVQWRDAWV